MHTEGWKIDSYVIVDCDMDILFATVWFFVI
jgi:hypothetical protein